MLFTAACYVVYSCLYIVLRMSSTAGMLFQSNLAGYLLQDLLCDICLPAVAVNSQLLWINSSLFSLLLFLFRSKVVIKHCQKECVHTPYALRTDFTLAYSRLDTLPTYCYY